MEGFVYEKLSYAIIGVLYATFNELGYGYQERHYQKAISINLGKAEILYKREVYSPITYKEEKIGKYFLDFLIEDKIILEIKKGNKFFKKDIEQVYAYLKNNKLKLGIIARFTPKGVTIKRIVNLK